MESWVQSCRPRTIAFCNFPVHVSEVLRLPRKSDVSSYEELHLSHKNHLPKTKDLMLQNAIPLRTLAPWPPNISDEHVSCTAPATRNPSCQILCKYPTPAIVFGNATKPSRFVPFWQRAESLAPATQNDIWTSRALYILTSKCASGHNGAQLFTSHLARWLRTRRFSEPTFRPSGATNHWKNTVFRDFPTFLRTCIFFLLTLSLLWSSLFCSSLLWLFPPLLFHLSIFHFVGSLTFKLHSIIRYNKQVIM